jgi:hypothetical protein
VDAKVQDLEQGRVTVSAKRKVFGQNVDAATCYHAEQTPDKCIFAEFGVSLSSLQPSVAGSCGPAHGYTSGIPSSSQLRTHIQNKQRQKLLVVAAVGTKYEIVCTECTSAVNWSASAPQQRRGQAGSQGAAAAMDVSRMRDGSGRERGVGSRRR